MIRRFAAACALGGLLAGCSGAGAVGPQVNPRQAALGTTDPAVSDFADAAPKSALYAGNIDGAPGLGNIFVYSASLHGGSQKPSRTISQGTQRPNGMWVDSAGTLYVANIANGAPSYVDEFHPGTSKPFLTITEGLFLAGTVAVDKDGTVYVNNAGQNNAFVSVYAPGSVHVLRTIPLNVTAYQVSAQQMAFDPHGNLFVAVGTLEPSGSALHVVEIPAGSTQAKPFLTMANAGPGLAIDGAGNMYLVSGSGTLVFAPGSKKPSRAIQGAGGLISVTRAGALYALGGSGIVEFAPGGSQPVNTFALPSGTFSFGVAVTPGA
jgi:DNA-binding beta-propeller fold protein YncE